MAGHEIETPQWKKSRLQPSWDATTTKVGFSRFPENDFLSDDKLFGRLKARDCTESASRMGVRCESLKFRNSFSLSLRGREGNRDDMGIDTLRVKTILIVDKVQAVLDSTREFLDSNEFCVITAASAWEAIKLAMLCRLPIDVVLMDLEMPEMSAGDLARRLRVLQPTVPIIFMSASTADAEDFAGAPFLLKPFSKRDLIRSIQAALKDKSQVAVFNRTGLRRAPY
jgi:CheY-like chemotaxis protein